jgi:hypothetical protein
LIAKGLTFSQQKSTDVETTENKYDTNETVKQIIDHDLTYEKLCQAQKPVDK